MTYKTPADAPTFSSNNSGRVANAFMSIVKEDSPQLQKAASRYYIALGKSGVSPGAGDLVSVYTKAKEAKVPVMTAFADATKALETPKGKASPAQEDIGDAVANFMSDLKKEERKEWSAPATKLAWAIYKAEGEISHIDLVEAYKSMKSPAEMNELAEEMKADLKAQSAATKAAPKKPAPEVGGIDI
jgi:uncharacterized protein YcbK (DUF882 family)